MKMLLRRGTRTGSSPQEAPHRVAPRSPVLRTVGRMALWACVALVFVRGLGAILSNPRTTAAPASSHSRPAGFPDGDARAFAVAFARAYLTVAPGGEAQQRAVDSFFAQGLSDQAAVSVPSRGPGVSVAQAMVAREVSLGGSRALLTVAAFMSDGRTVYLTVPVARDEDGGLVVDDLPSFSAPPPRGSSPAQAPAPLTDAAAGAISDVAGRFLRAYLSGADEGTLAYFLAPGTQIAPMPGGLHVEQVGEFSRTQGSGPARAVSVAVRVREPASGAVYALRYRLTLIERDRWYVQAVAGGPSA